MNVTLSGRLAGKLRRECRKAGCPDSFTGLAAEAIARRWMLLCGLPCWRTSQNLRCRGRYSLLFPGGRRALVTEVGGKPFSLDRMALAKCDYQILVNVDADLMGRPEGWLLLQDLRDGEGIEWRPDPGSLLLRDMEDFPEIIRKPAHFRSSYLLGSLRLLITGEPKAPAPM